MQLSVAGLLDFASMLMLLTLPMYRGHCEGLINPMCNATMRQQLT